MKNCICYIKPIDDNYVPVNGKAYTEIGGEGILNAGVSAQAVPSSAKIYINNDYPYGTEFEETVPDILQ